MATVVDRLGDKVKISARQTYGIVPKRITVFVESKSAQEAGREAAQYAELVTAARAYSRGFGPGAVEYASSWAWPTKVAVE